ncbi:unnamed protein product [Plutella xylostella]|uniref:T-complex protein 1 subunit gamma n=1 Tax=Plutella xylostella TaxID=51655 RepID=A0A8S4ENJ0_PLUXY|nr:unnamed protein product [Plutella xylostella]
MFGGQPILVLSQNTKRESGRKVQLENINAGKTIADVIRTCLGPQAMLKMLMDPMGGIVMTNDGNAILREITVQHPAAKTMIEIARTQDEEVGDGTTSVIVLAGEMLVVAEPFLAQNIHPTVIIREYRQALEDAIKLLEDKISIPIDMNDREKLKEVIRSCIGTKYIGRWADLAVDIALDAVSTVTINENGRVEVDIKNYAKVEKIPGGTIEESKVLNGVMINKDVTHAKMRRYIENPRIILLDCNLEYKKGESQTNIEIEGEQMRRYIENPRIILLDCNLEYKKGESQTNIEIEGEQDFTKLLQLEEEHVQRQCEDIIALKPDIVFTEKGVSDLAQHYLVKAGITAIRRLRKTDNNRLARACGATIVNRTEELKESDVGTGAGKFEVKKIGDEYFTFVTECKNPKRYTRCKFVRSVARTYTRPSEATIVNRTEELKQSDVGAGAGKFEVKKIDDEYFTFVTECKNPKELKQSDVGAGAGKFEVKKIGDEYFTFVTECKNPKELKESDVGTGAGKFEVKKIGDEYFTFVTECKNPKACTILLRGASKDVLNEIERNLQDALHVAKNLVLNPRLVAGGGAVEMAVSQALAGNAAHTTPYRAVAQALEIIPRTLAQNCGANTIRTLTALRARHAAGNSTYGIDGETGAIVDMAEKRIWEPLAVKLQVYKTAVETAILLLRIDDIVSGSKKREGQEGPTPGAMAGME